RVYEGFAGDTLASALLANGVRIVARSFKWHRPRGLLGSGVEEPNAIVEVGEAARLTPNLKATQVELVDGLLARSVNCWPSAQNDIFAFLGWLSRFTPAGFYYKTFRWPNWHWFEPAIRRAAGLGTSPTLPDPDRYAEQHEHCDVLIVGAGPAGLAAALAASRAGARVVLAEECPLLGGALRWERHSIDGKPAAAWVESAERELRANPRVRLLTRTTAFGFYDHKLVALRERLESLPERLAGPGSRGRVRERLWHVRAHEVVLAAGAIERPLVFAGNDVPGVMLASAATSYAVQYAVKPGERAVIATCGDSAYAAAEALRACGVEIIAIIDTRPEPGELASAAEAADIPVLAGHAVARTFGARQLRALECRALASEGKAWRPGPGKRIDCDLLCVSGGWTPTVHLYSQAGGRLRYAPEQAALLPGAMPAGVRCAGAMSGDFALQACLQGGFAMGEAAAHAAGAIQARDGASSTVPHSAPSSAANTAGVAAFWSSPPLGHRPAWVDLQNDVTRADLELATRENLRSVEHVKRYTTLGMAVDQGKTSNMNALGILAELTGRELPELGTTTFRPAYDPVTLGALAGGHVGAAYHPLRRTPLDRWHAEHGAVMEDFGGWLRPAWYTREGESRESCVRFEKRATRSGVSLFDGSPLGKIEVRGPDAATFVNRMYYNNMRTLAPGQVRYGVMLNEHGIVIDDGVCLRLAEDHFLVSTTSGGAARIFSAFEDWLQCQWPQLRVLLTNVTSQWGNVAVAGPRARALLERLGMDIDLRPQSFPHLSVRAGTVEGVPLRVARVGYTGEQSFEINIPAAYSLALWQRLLEHGRDLDAVPIGIEALQELRTEKGYLHVGTDTDGRTLPQDIGMGAVLARKSDDFVGRRSLTRTDAMRPDRLHFVGIASEDPQTVLPVGAHILADREARTGSHGYVTSSCMSEALGRSVALGLIAGGQSRTGETIAVYSHGKVWPARIVAPQAYDPKGERLHA
ncbi:MAG TPA: sarcosine oxidase subunit alpha family protein, partial [Steroidobacteraceae bacterium]|nr:sarcosine oxidase subunit alpha family protein [Steroidobacteraceae bacterium]